MATMRPVSDWPNILCGPMVRQTHRGAVSVFLATKKAARVTLNVYSEGNVSGLSPAVPPPISLSGSKDTVQIGKNLHVVLVTASDLGPAGYLMWGKRYAYDVSLTFSDGSGHTNLFSEDLLTNETPLGYTTGMLPSVLLPAGINDLHVVHASCRKMHAEGRDSIPMLDRLIEENLDSIERPQQLFLTGDQIYADDVAMLVSRIIIDTGVELVGWQNEETIVSKVSTSSELIPGPNRYYFIEDETLLRSGVSSTQTNAISSHEIPGHLIFLADFYTMYILSWSDALWPREGSSYAFPTEEEISKNITPDYFTSDRTLKWKKLLKKQRENVPNYVKTIAKVRRALANISTYMIFDDHEVTDDWYLNGLWRKEALENPLAKRIIRNGLIGYAIFQSWGNQPEYFEPPSSSMLGSTILEQVTYNPTLGHAPIGVNPDALDAVLDLNSTAPTMENSRMYWDFFVPGKEHSALALDTRTHRHYPAGASEKGAGLIRAEALDFQFGLLESNPDSKATFIISGTPVLGLPLLEELLQPAKVKMDGPSEADNEPWIAHKPTFQDFLKRIANLGNVVFLSGDVHYAFSCHLAYFNENPVHRARIVQLTSSSSKNEDTMTRILESAAAMAIANRTELGYRDYGWLGFDVDIPQQVQKELKSAVMASISCENDADRTGCEIVDLYFKHIIEERFSAPSLITVGPWISDEAYEIVRKLDEGPRPEGMPAPSWRYNLSFVNDVRTANQKYDDYPGLAEAISDWDESMKAYVLGSGSVVVGVNNLGSVKFEVDSISSTIQNVIHRIFCRDDYAGAEVQNFIFYTKHVIPFTTPTDSEKPRVKP